MSEISLFPGWLGDHVVGDACFAAAYDAVPAERRAWVKTTLARHAALYGACGAAVSSERTGQGWRLLRRDAPCAWGVLLASVGAVSPAKLAAALMPMLQAGVAHIVVVFAGKTAPAPDSLPVAALAALELAGQEQVAALSFAQAGELVRQMAANEPEGCVVALDAALPRRVCGDALDALDTVVWRPRGAATCGVWCEGAAWDWDGLAWAHPDMAVTAWNAGKMRLPKGFASRIGDFAACCGQGYGALFVPDDLAASAVVHAPVVLGPGHEGCWMWPDLGPAFFRTRRVGLCG
ncbi:MAG: hypothetical protein AB7E47_11295 [Desulfovibrionaceae bacterium]